LGCGSWTIRTWLSRSGQQGQKLHARFLVELELIHVQLDELWANVQAGGQAMWLWVAIDAKTKLIPVMQVGARTQAMAYAVVHELKGRLRAGCVPVFSTDGLRAYSYALTAHFGRWERTDGQKPRWMLVGEFVYGQVIKYRRQYRTVAVERRLLCGAAEQ
jgi:transposase-like protein